tara:strand:+ start:217 stop:420 length:204 start_codon:yes stop_codon:yes gene_type:complete
MSKESEEKYFDSRWLVVYTDVFGEQQQVYIDADYKVYNEDRIKELFLEIHPEWTVKEMSKVDKLPWD